MTSVDPRLVTALSAQLRRRNDGTRVGWKLGIGARERLGGMAAIGHLTSATVLDCGSAYDVGNASLHADAEVAVEIAPDGEIARYAPALELVDLSGPDDDAHSAIAGNVFHRAVAFGPWTPDAPTDVRGAIVVNGDERDSAERAPDLERLIRDASRVLEAVGERFEAGDRVITGNVVQVPVGPGERVEADVVPLGNAWLELR